MKAFADRVADHRRVGSALASMSDVEVGDLLNRGFAGRPGIGGTTRMINVENNPVFVKLVRVTDRELETGPQCTANLFDLPTWYQYGVGAGSTGFSVWRELAAHRAVTDWVLTETCGNFPMLFHWRVLSQPSLVDPGTEADDIERAVRFWRGSIAVQTRLRALASSSTVLALFVEHIPFSLRRWVKDQLAAGPETADSAVALVDDQLIEAVGHLRSAGFTHFDAHFDNILTDGQRVYLADFGLTTARRFELNSAERRFFDLTVDHDLAYCAAALVNTIVGTLITFPGPRERNEYVRRCATHGGAAGLDGRAAAVVVRYAGIATVVNDFYWRLHGGDQTAAYPSAGIAAALTAAGIATA